MLLGKAHTLVRLAHVFAGPWQRTTKGERQELLLLPALLVHAHVGKEVLHTLVGQHLDVKRVHHGVDGRLAAQFLIQAILAGLQPLGFARFFGEGPLPALILGGDGGIGGLAADRADRVGGGLGSDSGRIGGQRGIHEEGHHSGDGSEGGEDQFHGWTLS